MYKEDKKIYNIKTIVESERSMAKKSEKNMKQTKTNEVEKKKRNICSEKNEEKKTS